MSTSPARRRALQNLFVGFVFCIVLVVTIVLAPTGSPYSMRAVVAVGRVGNQALTPTETAEITSAGTVAISIVWTGTVQYPVGDKSPSQSGTVTVTEHCSGFVVGPSGYIMSATHCFDPKDPQLKQDFVKQMLDDMVASNVVTPAGEQTLLATSTFADQCVVEGQTTGTQPTSAITVITANSRPDYVGTDAPLAATVIPGTAVTGVDATLLRVNPPVPLLALELASAAPPVGTTVGIDGYPAIVDDSTDIPSGPTFTTGQVTNTTGSINGQAVLQLGGVTVDNGLFGGPVVDNYGRVVGMVTSATGDYDNDIGFADGVASLGVVIGSHKLGHTLGVDDRFYRAGIYLYYGGHPAAAAPLFDKLRSDQPTNFYAQQYQYQTSSYDVAQPPSVLAASVAIAAAYAALMIFLRISRTLAVSTSRHRRR